MESRKLQEQRSRQRVSPRGILAAGLTAGALNFIMSGGGPWSTAGTMNAIMGRDVSMNLFALAAVHFAVAFVYATLIGFAIYRFRLVPALLIGVAVGIVLYGVNFVVFRGLSGQMHSPESRAFLTHIVFSLLAAGVYKGASVPRPTRGAEDEGSPGASPKEEASPAEDSHR
ncbi:MAG: hypothetical protein M3463_16670 [Verrucomicrobiota bacterium]|nr:hypothetical protein [Verrucomicrobiota bacterium]